MIKTILVLLIANSLTAQQLNLSLEDAVTKAKDYSPDLKMQDNQIKQLQYDTRAVKGEALPQVSTSYDVTNFMKKPMFGNFSLNSNYQRTFNFTIRQALFRFGAVASALQASEEVASMSLLQREALQDNIEYATKVGYFTVLLAEKQLEIVSTSLKNAKDNLKILNQYFSSGRPPQGDLIRLQADVASRTAQLEEAQYNYDLARQQLLNLLGLSASTDLKLTDSLGERGSPISTEPLMKNMMSTSPTLRALQKQIDFKDNLAKSQRARLLPTVDAQFNYSSSERSDQDIWGTDMLIDSAAIGVVVNWNIWDGGTSNAQYQKAKVEKNRAEIQLQQQRDQLQLQLRTKVDEYNTLRANIETNQKSVKLAQESFRLSQNRFRTGKASVTELNNSEALLTQTQIQQAMHQFRLVEALATIEMLTQNKKGL